jgi:hypothetical protein
MARTVERYRFGPGILPLMLTDGARKPPTNQYSFDSLSR